MSEYSFNVSTKNSCNWRLLVWGMMGSMRSVSGGSWGERAVQSMSGRLKSPESHMSLSAWMRYRNMLRACRWFVLVEGGL